MSDRMEDLIRQDRPHDPKRWCLVRGTQTVMVGFLMVCIATVRPILKGGDIQPGAGWVLVALAGLLLGGTVAAHFKRDEPMPPAGGDR